MSEELKVKRETGDAPGRRGKRWWHRLPPLGWLVDRSRHVPEDLTEEELEALVAPDPRKGKLRWVLFVAGLAVVGLSLYLIFGKVVLDGVEVVVKYEGQEFHVNLSVVPWVLIGLVGLWLVARGVLLNTNRLRENTTYIPFASRRRELPVGEPAKVKVRSFASSRLVAAVLLLLVAVAGYILFGVELTSENDVGSWLVLGGPSMFYPTSVLPLVFSVGLFLYSILSSAIVTFSQTKHFYVVEEYRFLAPWITEIPRDRVRGVYFSNCHTGAKLAWVVPFLVHAWWLVVDGVSFFNPASFGQAHLVGGFYLFTAAVDVLVLALLLFKHGLMIQIHTDEKRYELQFSPPAATPSVVTLLEKMFGIDVQRSRPPRRRKLGKDDKTGAEEGARFLGLARDYHRLLAGITFVALAAASRIWHFYAGELLRFALLTWGTTLFVKGFKEDFSSPRNPLVLKERVGVDLQVRRRWVWYSETHRFLRSATANRRFGAFFATLDAFDYAAMFAVPFFSGLELASVLLMVPASSPAYAQLLAPHLSCAALVLTLLLLVVTNPQPALEVDDSKVSGVVYRVRFPGLPVDLDTGARTSEKISLATRWKKALRVESSKLTFRVGIILGSLLAGIALAAATIT